MFVYPGGYAVLNARTAQAVGDVLITDDVILCDATKGAFAITLPAPAVVHAARQQTPFYIKKIDASANAVTVTGAIDGAASNVLAAQYDAIAVFTDGNAYYILANLSAGGGGGGGANASQDILQVGINANIPWVSGTPAIIPFNVVDVDTQGTYDNTTYRYTPNVAGYYMFNLSVSNLSSAPVAYTLFAFVYKNGAYITNRRGTDANYSTALAYTQQAVLAGQIVQLNGTTDYIEFFANVNTGTQNLQQVGTFASGVFLHS